MAKVRFEVGPCDDDAFLWLDGSKVVALKLGESRAFTRDLADGDHSVRFIVVNGGAWAWRAVLSIKVGSHTLVEVDQSGNTGPAAPQVFNQRWDFEVKGSELA